MGSSSNSPATLRLSFSPPGMRNSPMMTAMATSAQIHFFIVPPGGDVASTGERR